MDMEGLAGSFETAIERGKDTLAFIGKVVFGPVYYTGVGLHEGMVQITDQIAPHEKPAPATRDTSLHGMVGDSIMRREAELFNR